MDLAELDRQYDARGTVDDIAPYLERYESLSAQARCELEVVCNVSYGPKPEETFDFFPAGRQAPVFVFIHGGYWRLLSKDESSFFAGNFVAQGIAVAALNYELAPQASLDEIVRQVRAAVAISGSGRRNSTLTANAYLSAGLRPAGTLPACCCPIHGSNHSMFRST